MKETERRTFLRNSGLAITAAAFSELTPISASAQMPKSPLPNQASLSLLASRIFRRRSATRPSARFSTGSAARSAVRARKP